MQLHLSSFPRTKRMRYQSGRLSVASRNTPSDLSTTQPTTPALNLLYSLMHCVNLQLLSASSALVVGDSINHWPRSPLSKSSGSSLCIQKKTYSSWDGQRKGKNNNRSEGFTLLRHLTGRVLLALTF